MVVKMADPLPNEHSQSYVFQDVFKIDSYTAVDGDDSETDDSLPTKNVVVEQSNEIKSPNKELSDSELYDRDTGLSNEEICDGGFDRCENSMSRDHIDDEDTKDEVTENFDGEHSVKRKRNVIQSDDEDSNEVEPDSEARIEPYKLMTDIFDTEETASKVDASEPQKKPTKNSNSLKMQQKIKEERNKIYSESQRMLRDSRVNLPYHTPKQLTLSDFLNRKKNVPSSLKIPRGKLKSLQSSDVAECRDDGPVDDSQDLIFDENEQRMQEVDPTCDDDLPPLVLEDSEKQDFKPVADANCIAADDGKTLPVISDHLQNENVDALPGPSGLQRKPKKENDSKDVGKKSMKTLASSIIDEVKTFTPKLDANPSSIIDLDDDQSDDVPRTTPTNDGLLNLMQRFVSHSSMKHKATAEKQINLSVVEKDTDEDGQTILKQNNVLFTIPAKNKEDQENSTRKSPGSKLIHLKERLQAKIFVKREQERQKRVHLHKLDNENFDDHDGDDEEEEEEEMTDEDETDEEPDKDVRRELFHEEAECKEDESADVEGMDTGNEESNIDGNLDDEEPSIDDKDENSQDEDFIGRKKKKIAVIEDDDDDDSQSISLTKADTIVNDEESQASPNIHDKDNVDADESFELTNAMFPPNLPASGMKQQRSNASDSDSSIFATPVTNVRKMQDNLPIEDSQDLFALDDWNNFGESRNGNRKSDDLKLSLLGDSQIVSTCKEGSNSWKKLMLDDTQSSSDDRLNDELLDLCSGIFSVSDSKAKNSNKIFDDTQVDKTSHNDELMALCSGSFTNPVQATSVDDEFEVLSNHEEIVSDEDTRTHDLEEEYKHNLKNQVGDESDSSISYNARKRRMQFFENEAELSGSDIDSDEDFDVAEEDDVLDEELGDQDVLPSEAELRSQIGRVHLKTMLDQDKRELRLYQEMFLEDGDLHGDDKSRTRQFRWQKIDDENESHIPNNSDAEIDNKSDEEDTQWRLKRHEREKWILEQNNEVVPAVDDGIFSFGKKILVRQQSYKEQEKDVANNLSMESDAPKDKQKSHPLSMLKNNHKGSFLSRKRNSLNKIAQFSEKGSNVNMNGAKQSKNFVFAIKSPPPVDKTVTKQSSDGHISKKMKITSSSPVARPSMKRSNSLFSYL